ncbi:MAG: hypothetical protein ACT4O2_12965, partial [Beijerinckiaceae bacterium]
SGRGRRGGEAANFAVQHDAAAPQTGLLSPPPHQKLKFFEVPTYDYAGANPMFAIDPAASRITGRTETGFPGTFLIGLSTFFQDGVRCIDWIEGKFKLNRDA